EGQQEGGRETGPVLPRGAVEDDRVVLDAGHLRDDVDEARAGGVDDRRVQRWQGRRVEDDPIGDGRVEGEVAVPQQRQVRVAGLQPLERIRDVRHLHLLTQVDDGGDPQLAEHPDSRLPQASQSVRAVEAPGGDRAAALRGVSAHVAEVERARDLDPRCPVGCPLHAVSSFWPARRPVPGQSARFRAVIVPRIPSRILAASAAARSCAAVDGSGTASEAALSCRLTSWYRRCTSGSGTGCRASKTWGWRRTYFATSRSCSAPQVAPGSRPSRSSRSAAWKTTW